jgi:hypothetical protein
VKPSRWLYNPPGCQWPIRSDFVTGLGATRYYRRLCAHYIGEARRWHRVALRSPDVRRAYRVLLDDAER